MIRSIHVAGWSDWRASRRSSKLSPRRRLSQLAPHLIEVNERAIHHFFAGADLNRRDGIGSVATLGTASIVK